MSENYPHHDQDARHRFLRKLWPEMIDIWRNGSDNPAAKRAIAAGAAPADVAQLARAVAYETVFSLLYYLNDDQDPDSDTLPHWHMIECSPDGKPTGERLQGLYEDLLSYDPSGKEGSDLWR